MSTVQVLSTSPQAQIIDGGFGPDGERRQIRIDARGVGRLPDWASSLPAVHRLVTRGVLQILEGALSDPRAPATEPPVKAHANPELIATQLLNLIASMPAEQRAAFVSAVAKIG